MSEDIPQTPLLIPFEALSADILKALIEEFVLREGTNYGDIEFTLDKKVEQVLKQIQKKDVLIVFDFKLESATLMMKSEFMRLEQSGSY